MAGNILAKFEYNGKTYVYYVIPDKPKNLLYGYIENEVIRPVVDINIFKIMEELSNKIFVSIDPSDHVRLTKIRFKNKLFQIMYDKKSKLKFFYEIKDNSFFMPIKEDQDELCNIYNKTVLNFADRLSEEEKIKRIHKALKIFNISGVVAIAIMGASLIFNNFIKPDMPVQEEQAVTQTVTVVEPTAEPTQTPKIDFSLEKLMDALNQNPNLSKEEKAFIADHFDILLENAEYVDMNLTMQKLTNLTIEYIKDTGNKFGATRGNCYYWIPKIDINPATSFEDCDKTVLSHELFHILSNSYGPLGISIVEAITEIATVEKSFYLSTSYREACVYVKMLAEIIGAEPLKAFYFTGDINYIIKALTKIIPDEDMAYELISSLDDINVYESEFSMGWLDGSLAKSGFSKEQLVKAIEETNSFLGSTLSSYFYAARGYLITDDFIMKVYDKQLNDSSETVCALGPDGEEVLIDRTGFYINKGYFWGEYVNNHPEAELRTGYYFGEGEERSFKEIIYVIDDSNRKLTSIEGHPGNYIFDAKVLSSEIQKVN